MAVVVVGQGTNYLQIDGSDGNYPLADNKYVVKYTPQRDMDLERIVFYSGATDAGVLVKGVIYSDNSSDPDALLGTTNEQTGVTDLTWETLTFAAPVALTGGTPYWIGLIADTNLSTRDAPRAGWTATRALNADSYADGPADPFGAPTKASGVKRAIRGEGDADTSDVSKLKAHVVFGPLQSELVVAKAMAYAVVVDATEVSKLKAHVVIGTLPSEVAVCKAVAYVVLHPPSTGVSMTKWITTG